MKVQHNLARQCAMTHVDLNVSQVVQAVELHRSFFPQSKEHEGATPSSFFLLQLG
jgi:hypothetical protein